MFYYKFFGSKGNELDSVGSYFSDEGDIDSAKEMRPGSSQNTHMHILYDGDGDYYINFDNFHEKLEVKIPIVKK